MRRLWLSVSLSLPATMIWMPICLHYFVVFSWVSWTSQIGHRPEDGPTLVPLGSALVAVWCGTGVVGILSLWVFLLWGQDILRTAGWKRSALVAGLAVGLLCALFALGLAGYLFLSQEPRPYWILLLFGTVLGPIAALVIQLMTFRQGERTGGVPGSPGCGGSVASDR